MVPTGSWHPSWQCNEWFAILGNSGRTNLHSRNCNRRLLPEISQFVALNGDRFGDWILAGGWQVLLGSVMIFSEYDVDSLMRDVRRGGLAEMAVVGSHFQYEHMRGLPNLQAN